MDAIANVGKWTIRRLKWSESDHLVQLRVQTAWVPLQLQPSVTLREAKQTPCGRWRTPNKSTIIFLCIIERRLDSRLLAFYDEGRLHRLTFQSGVSPAARLATWRAAVATLKRPSPWWPVSRLVPRGLKSEWEKNRSIGNSVWGLLVGEYQSSNIRGTQADTEGFIVLSFKCWQDPCFEVEYWLQGRYVRTMYDSGRKMQTIMQANRRFGVWIPERKKREKEERRRGKETSRRD